MIKINIVGDFFISNKINQNVIVGKDIIKVFNDSNFNIINLESPITKGVKEHAIIKTGPHLNGSSNTFSVLKRLNTHLVTLANNHIMDYGAEGLKDTLLACQNHSINFIGAGMSLKEAQRPFIIEKDGMKITTLNFAENEWASAESNKPGANPLDIIDNVNQIKEAKVKSDFVIVVIHGGHEYYHLPSPRMVKQYRFYAENGAAVIVGHHPHCIGGYEVHQGVPIFYSLGNFLFIMPSKFEAWYTGLILHIQVNENKKMNFELIPVKQSKTDHSLRMCIGLEKEKIVKEVEKNSSLISNNILLKNEWDKLLYEKKLQYLGVYSPINFFTNKYIKRALRKFRLDTFFLKKHHYKQILNNIRCEAHFDVTKDIIKKFLEEK